MDTETHYVTYDPTAIWDEMIVNYVEAGGDILYPGDEKEMLLRSVQANIVQVLAGVDNALRMKTLRYAVGDYLDLLGETRGCKRIEAVPAKATATITTNITGRSETIPAGTLMTADGELYFALESDIVLTGYSQSFIVSIISDRPGSKGNALKKGSQMQMAGAYDGIKSVVAATDAVGGNDKEEDEAYRERIRSSGLASVTTGTAGQYEAIAKSVSSKIIDVKAFNTGLPGVVEITLLISDDADGAAVVNEVTSTLMDEKVRVLTDTVEVNQALNATYHINAQYECDNSAATNDAIAKAALEYQKWQENTIGRAFDPNKLMVMLYNAGATRVIFGTGSNFSGGALAYSPINLRSRCKGTIALSAMI